MVASIRFVEFVFRQALIIAGFLFAWTPAFAAPQIVTGDGSVSLTGPERAWLNSHPELVLAPSPDFPPIEFIDHHGHYAGISAEYVRILERKLGVKFKIKKFGSWSEIEEHTRAGEVDVWGAATPTADRSAYMTFSRPFLSFPALIITRKNGFRELTLEGLKGLKVVSLARHVTDQYLNDRFPNLNRILAPDVGAGLKMVSFGDADAIVVNAAPASYYISELGLTNLTVAGQSEKDWPLSFASRRDTPQLASILQKALDGITPEERNAITRSWVNLQYEDRVSHRAFGATIVAGVAVALLLTVLLYLVTRSLKTMVRQRTAQLRDELDQRKRVEAELLTAEERLTRFFEAAFEGIFFHVQGVVTDVNPAVKEILGYAPADIVGKQLMDFIAPESRALVYEKMKTNDPGSYEVTAIACNGDVLPLEVRARSVDMGGMMTRVVGFRDISNRKRNEREILRYQNELEARTESLETIRSISEKLYYSLDLRTVAEQAVQAMMLRSNSPSVGLYLLDDRSSGLNLFCSRGFSEPLLQKAVTLPLEGSLSGTAVRARSVQVSSDFSVDQRLEPAVRDALLEYGYRGAVTVPLLAEERVLGTINLLYREPYLPAPGVEQELQIIGQTVGLAVSHALTLDQLRNEMGVRRRTEEALQRLNTGLEQRVAERTAELAEAKERAEAADHLKSAFLATMSHELRTPLNSIIGFTGVILQGMAGPLNDEQRKQMEMVKNSASHLLELINDVLDLSKIEAGQLTLSCHEFDVVQSLEKTGKTIRPLVEAKGLLLTVDIPRHVLMVNTDQRRVEQVVLNLLSNAVKFTDKGTVSLSCRVLEQYLEISVADSGIGIKQVDIPNLFKPFRQLEAGLSRRFEGTGLGLSICKKLVKQLGGEIRVDSVAGEGSIFSFTLPFVGERGSHEEKGTDYRG